MKAILGKKVGMTHIFDKKGNQVPVTVIEAGPCYVVQIRIKSKDKYNAVQLGFGEAKKLKKPQEGHLRKLKIKNEKIKILREFRVEDPKILENLKPGDKIDVSVFKENDIVTISGTSKGKGFAGVIKRHNFHCGPMSHGSHHHRAPGSIGAAFPQRVFKGQKLPGRMGSEKTTIKNVKVVNIDTDKNILVLKGAVPGPKKGLVIIQGE